MNGSDSSLPEKASVTEVGVINKKVTEKDLEKWEVAQLKGDIAPISRPSTLFEEMEERRKTQHNALIEQLTEDLQAINLNMEKNVKLSSYELKAHMKYFDDKLQDILQIADESEVASYDNSKLLKFQIKANEYKSEQQKLINELYEDLIKLEDERSAKNEKLLRAACEEMIKIGYFLPYEVQMFVEGEVLALNQLSLSNRRNYEDLKLTLTLVTEQNFKSFLDKVECFREKWIQKKLQEAYSNLQDEAQNKIVHTMSDCYVRLELKGEELICELSPDGNFTSFKAEEWSKNVQDTVTAIETHGKNLIGIYKNMLNEIYQNFSREAEDIKSQLSSVQSVEIEERIIKPIMFDKQKELEELELFWQDYLADIRVQLKKLNLFLADLVKLWNRHSERVCESQKLISMALNKAEENNQPVLQELEIKFNIALDALRQEHNKNELEKSHEAVNTILNSIKAKYESIYLNEVSIIEDYYKMMDLEGDVLSAEFKEFIFETHPLDPNRILHCYNDPYRISPPRGSHIVRIITGCAQRIKGVMQWKFGIWSALSALSERTRETLQPKAEKWVEEKIASSADKKTLQLELIEKRFGRVKIEIYDKRLREIETHEEILNNHIKKVQAVYAQLKRNLANLEERELENLNQMKAELEEAQEKAKQEDRPGVIRGKQAMAGRNKEEFEERIKSNFEKFRVDCDSKIYDLKQANINLIKSMKLFHEGGNYSSEEGKMYATTLEGIDKEVNTEIKNFEKESSKKENELIKKASAIISPAITLFSLLYEETSFKSEMSERLQSFEAELLEITETLNSDFSLLNRQNSCLSRMISNWNKPLNENVYKFWMSMLRLLYSNMSILFFPMEFLESPDASLKAEEEGESVEGEFFPPGPCCCNARFPVKPVSSKTFTNRTTEVDGNLSCKDFKNELFGSDSPPNNDGTFMGTVQFRLWSMMDTVQKIACAFYRKVQGRKIIRTDLIPPNYETLMKNILVRLKSYDSQFEQFWLRVVLDFLPVIGRLKITANAYIERKLNEYDYTVEVALKTFEDDFVACLECQSFETRKEFEALEKKLLALHGYPQNQDLLSCLEEEVVRRTAGLGISWESAIKKFKSHVKCFRINHVKEKFEIRKIESQYLKLKDTLFVNDLGEDLLDTILGYCDAGGFCPRGEVCNPSARRKSSAGDSAGKDTLEAFDLGLNSENKWATSEWYLNQLRDLVERERFTGDRPPECPPCPEGSVESFLSEDVNLCTRLCAPPLHILLEIIDFNEKSEEILKRLNLSLGRLKSFASSQENVHEENLFRWLNIWKFNVKKVQNLYCVTCGSEAEPEKQTSSAEVENNKPETEKTSASVTLTLPRPCSKTKIEFKPTPSNIPKLKSRYLENKRVSNENLECPGVAKTLPINFYKSSLLNTTNTDQGKYLKNNSLIFISPREYHGHIPLLKRPFFFNSTLTMSPPTTRFPSPLKKNSPKEKQIKMKTISFEQDSKKSSKTSNSRSSSPTSKDRRPSGYKKIKTRSPSLTSGNLKSLDKPSKFGDPTKVVVMSPRINPLNKKKSKVKLSSSSNLDLMKEAIVRSAPLEETGNVISKQSSQPILCKSEKLLQPQEKIGLDDLKSEVYTGDHRRLSFEKVHLRIEKKEVETLTLGEMNRSYLLTYSSEDLQNDEVPLSIIKNLSRASFQTFSKDETCEKLSQGDSKSVIRTLSGQELILTPSMKLHLDKGENGCHDVEISEILNETEKHFESQKKVHIPLDEASEYDSEVSTDRELAWTNKPRQQSPCRVASYKDMSRKRSASAFWKSRESELLNDVDYRQSVYHPAVSRMQKDEKEDIRFRGKSESMESTFEFTEKSIDSLIQSQSECQKKYGAEKMDNSIDEQSWATPFEQSDGEESYTSKMKNTPLYDVKRVRTNKERISGALLHFTLKIIRLLAILNIWPGDNCYILTSQSLRFSR